jgi:hypothetical protein
MIKYEFSMIYISSKIIFIFKSQFLILFSDLPIPWTASIINREPRGYRERIPRLRPQPRELQVDFYLSWGLLRKVTTAKGCPTPRAA